MNHGALGPLEHLGYFGGGQAVAHFSFYLQDDIARANSGFVSRRPDKWSEDHGLVVTSRDGHSYAVIFSLLVFLEEGVLLGIKKIRVRVQDVKHAGNRAIIDDFVGVNRVGIIAFDDR